MKDYNFIVLLLLGPLQRYCHVLTGRHNNQIRPSFILKCTFLFVILE